MDLETLKHVKLLFDVQSDYSTKCNGYTSLCELIEKLENNKFKEGQELKFNVYGNILKGNFVSYLNEKTVTIRVTYDDYSVTDIGCTANVDISFLEKNQ